MIRGTLTWWVEVSWGRRFQGDNGVAKFRRFVSLRGYEFDERFCLHLPKKREIHKELCELWKNFQGGWFQELVHIRTTVNS